jgi:hypothetical protein
MKKRSVISVVVIFIFSMFLDFLIHGKLLFPDYSLLPSLYRTPEASEHYFPFMLFAHVLFAIGFVWIYGKGKEDKPFLAQGIRFGIAVALLATIPTYLIYFAVQPLPATLVYKQIIFSVAEVLILGVVVAWLNK